MSSLLHRELETERMRLVRPRRDDGPRVHAAFAADPEVTRFLRWGPNVSLAESEAAARATVDRMESGREHTWRLVLRDGELLVGSISLWIGDDDLELGFVLGRPWWGRGLMTEATRRVVAWCREEAPERRLWATCDLENRASARVLEKAGLCDRGRFGRPIVRPNLGPEPRASRLYEWPEGAAAAGRHRSEARPPTALARSSGPERDA